MSLPEVEIPQSVQSIVEAAKTDFPVAPLPESDLVALPAGLVLDGKLIKTAIVKELNGAAEEKIFRALLSANPFHIRNTIIECGLVRVGDEPEKKTQKILPDLIIGDLDAILLGIYRMTYGDRIEIKGWKCPVCGDTEDIGLDISEDIPVKAMKDISEARFEVELKRGAKAKVRLPNGGDQAAAGDSADRTLIERNTILLQRCIEEVVETTGISKMLLAFPTYAQQMGIKDRHTVIQAIAERQPGPQLTAIKFVHNSCGKEVTLGLDLADLFLG